MRRERGRLLLRGGVVATLIVAQGVLLATSAQAAAANVYLDGTTVEYHAGSAANVVTITHVSSNIIIDDSFALTPGTGCWSIDSTKVACADGGVTGVRVYAGAGNDRVNSAMDLPASLLGEDGDDLLAGGDGDDVLRGGAGDDRMAGGAGRDSVTYYGQTADVTADIDGVTGDDGVPGENDSIMFDVEDLFGGNGDDDLRGDGDANLIQGNGGNDTIYGFGGNDTIYGSDGDDYLDGYDGNDQVHGGDGDDRLRGWSGNDLLYGENGDDRLEGGLGVDQLYGGNDNDELYGEGDLDISDGGPDGDVCWDATPWVTISCE